jgi:type II secretory pathway component PulF
MENLRISLQRQILTGARGNEHNPFVRKTTTMLRKIQENRMIHAKYEEKNYFTPEMLNLLKQNPSSVK